MVRLNDQLEPEVDAVTLGRLFVVEVGVPIVLMGRAMRFDYCLHFNQ